VWQSHTAVAAVITAAAGATGTGTVHGMSDAGGGYPVGGGPDGMLDVLVIILLVVGVLGGRQFSS